MGKGLKACSCLPIKISHAGRILFASQATETFGVCTTYLRTQDSSL